MKRSFSQELVLIGASLLFYYMTENPDVISSWKPHLLRHCIKGLQSTAEMIGRASMRLEVEYRKEFMTNG